MSSKSQINTFTLTSFLSPVYRDVCWIFPLGYFCYHFKLKMSKTECMVLLSELTLPLIFFSYSCYQCFSVKPCLVVFDFHLDLCLCFIPGSFLFVLSNLLCPSLPDFTVFKLHFLIPIK